MTATRHCVAAGGVVVKALVRRRAERHARALGLVRDTRDILRIGVVGACAERDGEREPAMKIWPSGDVGPSDLRRLSTRLSALCRCGVPTVVRLGPGSVLGTTVSSQGLRPALPLQFLVASIQSVAHLDLLFKDMLFTRKKQFKNRLSSPRSEFAGDGRVDRGVAPPELER